MGFVFPTTIVILILSHFSGILCQGKVTTDGDGQSGTISFSTPDLSDEESHSPWMPDQLKCDACKVVAYQLYTGFETFNKNHKYLKYDIPESEVLDIVDETCLNGKTWESYGVKEVEKVKRLSGPGTDAADIPGVMAGGGKWPTRLMDMCEQYMGNIGEMEIYKAYRKDHKSLSNFQKFLCYGKGIQGDCLPQKSKSDKKKKNKEEL